MRDISKMESGSLPGDRTDMKPPAVAIMDLGLWTPKMPISSFNDKKMINTAWSGSSLINTTKMALKPGWYSPVSMIITHYLISLLFEAWITVNPERVSLLSIACHSQSAAELPARIFQDHSGMPGWSIPTVPFMSNVLLPHVHCATCISLAGHQIYWYLKSKQLEILNNFTDLWHQL